VTEPESPPPDDGGTTQTQLLPSDAPERIGPYRLLQKLGEGGMGEVWEAEQQEPVRRRVALKLIKIGMDSKQVVARFEAERQALALMNHPSVAKVFDAGTTAQGRPYFAMECVKGEPITRYCDRQRLSTRQRLELFLRVCDGVQHAHQKGIIHRDIKPSNVLVAAQEAEPVPKIIDFGVAKATEQRLTEKTLFTQMGVLIGTPEYMSPEQAEMTGLDVDTRTDVYSLGVLLYELLVGALPFDPKELRRAGFDGIRKMIREEEPSRPSARVSEPGEATTESAERRRTDLPTLKRQLRGDLDWITMKALEKDRMRRYGSPFELAADIRRHLDHEPVSASPPSVAYRVGKFVRRHRIGVAAGGLVALALVLGATLATVGMIRATRAERVAREEAATAEQVSEFLVELFEVADPEEARGNTITAREILDEGAARIEGELEDQPRVQARLVTTIGRVYNNLGLHDQAGELLERAVATRRELLGADHPETLAAMHELAEVLDSLRRNVEGEALAREVLEARRRALGPEHRDTLESMTLLGWFCWNLGRGDEARSLAGTAAEVRRRVLGNDHPDTLSAIHVFASMLLDEGEGAILFEETLEGRRRVLGEDHPDTLNTMNALAATYGAQGRLSEAEALHRERWEIARRVLGEDHGSTLMALVNLSVNLTAQGREAEAEALGMEAIERLRPAIGETHAWVHHVMSNLAYMYSDQGRHDDAERMRRESLDIRVRNLGRDHPDTWSSMTLLADLLVERRRLVEAEALFTEVLDRVREIHGAEHSGLAGPLWGLARLRLVQGKRDAAEPLFEESLKLQARHRGENSLYVDFARARYHALVGERDEAIQILKRLAGAGFGRLYIAQAADLISLRGDPEFQAIIAEVEGHWGGKE
jgi:non-specific serine/threonine protein kinase/serine/threonine-protein kinase